MEKRNMTHLILAACSVFLAVGLLGTLGVAEETEDVMDYNMYVQPYMISLNANSDSNAEFITTVSFGCYMNNEKITDSSVDFMIGDDVVVSTTNMRVTREGICQAYFDKTDIQGYAIDEGLNGVVDVTVTGSYTHEPISGEGSPGTIYFTSDGVVFFR